MILLIILYHYNYDLNILVTSAICTYIYIKFVKLYVNCKYTKMYVNIYLIITLSG